MTTFIATFAKKENLMPKQVQKQTGIRLPENLIIQLKKKARSRGVSFNSYVQHVLTKDVKSDIPYIDPNSEIDVSLLSMVGTIKMPSSKELESDPRLSAAFGL